MDLSSGYAAAAAVWIQIGIGVWLLTAARGRWSRLGGLASVGWGLIIWVFGEAFAGIFAPGLTWLFGAPGAALLYCVAGALVAFGPRLPPTGWARSPSWSFASEVELLSIPVTELGSPRSVPANLTTCMLRRATPWATRF